MSNRISKKERKAQLQAKTALLNKIPYTHIFNEMGMIETKPNTYSVGYVIEDISESQIKQYNNDIIMARFAMLLNELPADMSVQFVIHNRLISQDIFLKRVLVVPEKDPAINPWIERYNSMVTDNSTIGHNNVKKNKYFVVSLEANTPDEALALFKTEDEHIKTLFKAVCEINVRVMTIEERLRVIYSMFNPQSNEFGIRYNVKEGGLDLKALARRKINSKNLIIPKHFDDNVKNLNYIRINDDTYARVLFITSVPACVSTNLISDITNISSNMVFSCIYEPFDSMYAFNTATGRVTDNTVVKQQYKRDSLKDRKNRTISTTEQMVKNTEETYFERMALDTMKDAVALNEHGMLCTFTIILYADDLDILDRDTKLLNISTSKFACQVKPLDLQQLQGFQTSLPLCNDQIDCKRVLTIQRLSAIPPLNLQEILNKDGLFNGLNTINDNLVLLNRRNNPILAGIIAGTDHSGKTFQCKREIFNALISSNDNILVMSSTNEYDEFITTLGGVINEDISSNPFQMPEHYGISNADKYSKTLFLEALCEVVCRDKEDLIQTASTESAKIQLDEDISTEVSEFFNVFGEIDKHGCDEICKYIHTNKDTYPLLNQLVEFLVKYMEKHNNEINKSNRLQLYKIKTVEDTLILLDTLFCDQLEDRKKRKSTWLFLDSMDELMESEQSATFLEDYIRKMNDLQNIFTLVVQSSVNLFSENITSMRFADVIDGCGYFKLLNQAAVERKKYTEILNIPSALVNYITSSEVGKGIILTPASNVTFDDNFLTGNEEDLEDEQASLDFYKLFKM